MALTVIQCVSDHRPSPAFQKQEKTQRHPACEQRQVQGIRNPSRCLLSSMALTPGGLMLGFPRCHHHGLAMAAEPCTPLVLLQASARLPLQGRRKLWVTWLCLVISSTNSAMRESSMHQILNKIYLQNRFMNVYNFSRRI